MSQEIMRLMLVKDHVRLVIHKNKRKGGKS